MLLHNPFGPIFEKELRATSRRKRSYVLRVAYLGGLLLFLVLAYLGTTSGNRGAGVGAAQRAQQQSELGQIFFHIFTLFSTGAMAMIGPVLTSTAISSERLHKTLHVLLMTPISAWQIVTGKLFSRLLVALTLIGLSLPVVALVRLLGGVEVRQMFASIAICTAVAVVTAAMGLFFSTFVTRAYGVILFAYGLILLLWVGIPILLLVPHFNSAGPPFGTFRMITTISPFFAAAFVSFPIGALFTSQWEWCVTIQLVMAAALVAGSALMLRRVQRSEGSAAREDPSAPPVPVGGEADPGTAPAADSAAPGGCGRRAREVGNNPVLWRETGKPLFARRWQAVAGLLLFAAFLLGSYGVMWQGEVLDDEEIQFGYGLMFNAVMWLALAVLAGTAIAQEKESDTWTVLLATPISGRKIVLGKILGLCRRMIWPTLLILAHFSLFAAGGVIGWGAVVAVVWVILTCNAPWVASGVLLSLVTRRVTMAVILNLMLGIGLYVAAPVLWAILCLALDVPDDDVWELIWWTSPYTYIFASIEHFSPEFEAQRTVWMPADVLLSSSSFAYVLAGIGLVHLALAAGVVAVTIRRFNRLVGRAPQVEPLPVPAARDAMVTAVLTEV